MLRWHTATSHPQGFSLYGFYATTAELSSCDGARVAQEPEILTPGHFTRHVCQPLLLSKPQGRKFFLVANSAPSDCTELILPVLFFGGTALLRGQGETIAKASLG